MVQEAQLRTAELDLQGLPPFQLVEGAIGGASLPLLASYAVDRGMLLRAAGQARTLRR